MAFSFIFLLVGGAFAFLFVVFVVFAIIGLQKNSSNSGSNHWDSNNFTNQDDQDLFMNQMMYNNMNDINYNGVPDYMEQHQDSDGDGIPDYLDHD